MKAFRKQVSLAVLGAALVLLALAPSVHAAEMTLHVDPTQSTADFTLSDTLHTVHGSFQAKSGELRFDPGTGKISGKIIFDATSGHTDSQMRDKKMHKEILESGKYPEITFRPERVDGQVSVPGRTTVQVHGLFGIHGAEHETTTAVTIKFEGSHWEATAAFPVPYEKWGMKNPSMLFLRVGNSVEIDLHASGSLDLSASR